MLFLRSIFCATLFFFSASASDAQGRDMNLKLDWEFVADTVMGGVSTGELTLRANGKEARLTGQVSLENNGGFVQMAADLAPARGAFDASAFDGIEIEVKGNLEPYDLRLRTTELARPWQSFRASFTAPDTWTKIRIPFGDFQPHRTDATFDAASLRRVGILAIGRAFTADVSVRAFGFYSD